MFATIKKKIFKEFSDESKDKYLGILKEIMKKNMDEIIEVFRKQYNKYNKNERKILKYTLEDFINQVDKFTLISLLITIVTIFIDRIVEIFNGILSINNSKKEILIDFEKLKNPTQLANNGPNLEELENSIQQMTFWIIGFNIISIILLFIIFIITIRIIHIIVEAFRRYRLCKIYLSVIKDIEENKFIENENSKLRGKRRKIGKNII